ncbi:aminotransferase class I/II-fold pyridoxal phosphate-dependent enzyme [Alicyclobacillus curvatus]|jgi:methionine-gamma-lyase|nr:aminotransferase class I/II-fold pyridoxal phosphate-dependent enzyme [Alicyclobacillus curvatus]
MPGPKTSSHSGEHDDSKSVSVRPETTPLYTASVYTFPTLDDVRSYYADSSSTYLYRRNGNPNTRQVENMIASLEGTEAAVLAASGMAAIAQGCFALLQPGDSVLATEVLYGGTYAFFEQVLRPWGVDIKYVDVNDISALSEAMTSSVRMIYAETIANPLLQVTNLDTLGQFTAENHLYLVVDNTFATPALTQPTSYGSTLVVHSLTKYLNGHSDVIGGVACGSKAIIDRVRRFSETFGGVLSPYDAWMTERGLQTFEIRVKQQFDNAYQVAAALLEHKAIQKVYYPGLETHETHAVAKHILKGGFGAMVSFDLVGGEPAANAFVRACGSIPFAPSLGGVKTTISHPALTSHRAFSPEERLRLGITDGVIRLSVGIEPFERIWQDISQGLEAAMAY